MYTILSGGLTASSPPAGSSIFLTKIGLSMKHIQRRISSTKEQLNVLRRDCVFQRAHEKLPAGRPTQGPS